MNVRYKQLATDRALKCFMNEDLSSELLMRIKNELNKQYNIGYLDGYYECYDDVCKDSDED